MKTNYFLKSLALIALMALFTNVKAAEINVPKGATDTDIAAALDKANAGDVILINGTVTMKALVDVTKNVTFRGVGTDAYFDGGGNCRLFELHPDPIDGAKLLFDNLGFTGGNGYGSSPTDGGVARVYGGGVVEFTKCWFDSNQALRGGVFFVDGGGDFSIPALQVTCINCEMTNNLAFNGGGESRGGFLFVDGNANIDCEYCKITGNKSIGGRGGALCLFGNGTRRFFYCLFTDNKGGDWDDSGKIGDGEYEGGLAFITTGATTFESCAIVANQSWSHGGCIRGWGDTNTTITFINSTISKNVSLHDRPPFWISGDCTYTFVNCILAENLGSNSGNGSGFEINERAKANIFNSVFVRNYLDSGEGACDIRANADGATAAQLTVKNSLIGLIYGDQNLVTVKDNSKIPTKSNIKMYRIADEAAQPDYASMENSGVDFGQGLRQSAWGQLYYLLTPGTTVTKLGDPALLDNYDINTDLFGKVRTVAADGSISAAPTITSTPDYFDDSKTGIVSPKITSVQGNIRIIGIVENGILGVDFGTVKGQTSGQLLSVSGEVVENVFNCNVVGKGYYNVHAAPGIYLLRVVNKGNTYVQKVIVK